MKKILLATLASALLAPWALADELPSLEAYFLNPQFESPELSPDGKHLAVRLRNASGRMALAVVESDDIKAFKIIANYGDVDINQAHWINNDRLYYDFEDTRGEQELTIGSAFAINRDGSQRTQLMTQNWNYSQEDTSSHIKRRVLPWDYRYVATFGDGSNDLLVRKTVYNKVDYSWSSISLYRFDSKTLALTPLIDGGAPTGTVGWLINPDGVPLIGLSYDKDRLFLHLYDKANKSWSKLADLDRYDSHDFEPSFVDYQDTLYVKRAIGENSSGLYRYDLKARKIADEPIAQLDGFDFDAVPIFDLKARKFIGLHYQSDAWDTSWIDPAMKMLQKRIDEKLPGTINTISCGNCLSSAAYLITVRSDRSPEQYLLYRPGKDELVPIGTPHPDIEAKQMGRRDFLRVAARDGLSIPLYVTKPANAARGKLPTVVMVHEDPFMRGGSWEWEAQAQFLASRGYLVLEPEFRGSTGFGFKHYRAGWKQWGQGMVDDVADATRWAIAEGLADPDRIAIGGTNYGGYATLMGLIRYPELYRCGFQWLGVTDINLMFDNAWSNFTNDWLRYGMRQLVADPIADAAMIKRDSPLEQADKLRQPLLMAYGTLDARVPLQHGTELYSAIKRKNADVEWITYPDEGHGWYLEPNRIDFWKRVEAFLERNLKRAE